LKIRILVKPNSASASYGRAADGSLWMRIPAPATEGKANEAARELLSQICACSKRDIQLVSGKTSRFKIFEIPLEKEKIESLFEE
jgi:uncharacterized protein YggU (UPF0235/DUF167 family)